MEIGFGWIRKPTNILPVSRLKILAPHQKPGVALRGTAAKLLQEVLTEGAFASEALDRVLQRQAYSDSDRALLTEWVYGVLRRKATLDHFLQPCLEIKKTPDFLLQLLRISTYSFLFLDRLPAYAVLHSAVDAARVWGGEKPSKFVNAVLRRLQKGISESREWMGQIPLGNPDAKTLQAQDLKKWATFYSFPSWMLRRWAQRFSAEDLQGMLHTWNGVSPLDLRVNLEKISFESFLQRCEVEGVVPQRSQTPRVSFSESKPEAIWDWIRQGLATPQDWASYEVVKILAPRLGERGLDVCAGHGGKSAAIAEMLGGGESFGVYDSSSEKFAALFENFARLDLKPPHPVVPNPSAPWNKVDWILLDAPCSGSGTLGRKPELRWKLRAEDYERCARIQLELLKCWAPCLKEGGRLIYSVCSFEPEETRQVVARFLSETPDFQGSSLEEYLPGQLGHDGFFVAHLIRKPSAL